ncbi:MAG: NusG domain II-containing protein [Treponema sp.]|nr:NusG domain II-containing protein [Treponema sp.]
MNVIKTRVKLFDVIIIITVASLIIFISYFVYMKPQGKTQILIRGQDNEWTYPIEAEETVIVTGPLGNTVIRLNGQKTWIEASPCHNQNCVAAGIVSKQGQWAACLPNNVLLIIQGTVTEDNDVDAVVW